MHSWLGRMALAVSAFAAVGLLARLGVAAAIVIAPNAPLPWRARAKEVPPAALSRLHVADVRIPLVAARGSLATWLVEPATPAKATIVLLHGVRMDRRSLAPLALAASEAGYRAVLVDLRGHGESDGSYLTYGAFDALDVSRLLDVLEKRAGTLGHVGVYGFSYGAAVAIDLAAYDRRVESVVAVSPFSSLRLVVGDYRRRYLPGWGALLPDAWLQDAVDGAALLGRFDAGRAAPLSNIASVKAPLLLIHGDADTQVPLAHSRRLLAASGGRAQLEVIPGGTHETPPQRDWEAVRARTLRWFRDSLPAPAAAAAPTPQGAAAPSASERRK